MAINVDALNLCPQEVGGIYREILGRERWFEKVPVLTAVNAGELKVKNVTGLGGALLSCCEPGDDTATFGEAVVPIICIKKEFRFCNEELIGLEPNDGYRVTAGLENYGSIGELLANMQLDNFRIALSELAWNGGTLGAATYEGYIQMAEGSVTSTATNIYGLLQSIYMALPIDVRTSGEEIAIFVGEDFLQFYQLFMMDKNYNLPIGTYTPDREYPFIGFGNVRIIGVRALNGSGNALITPLSNIFWATNREADKDTYAWCFDCGSDEWINRIKTLFGWGFYQPEYAYVVTYDESILSNPFAYPVDIVAPRNAAGDAVLVEQKTATP